MGFPLFNSLTDTTKGPAHLKATYGCKNSSWEWQSAPSPLAPKKSSERHTAPPLIDPPAKVSNPRQQPKKNQKESCKAPTPHRGNHKWYIKKAVFGHVSGEKTKIIFNIFLFIFKLFSPN